MTKFRVVFICLMLLFVFGCVTPTQDNPFGIRDPNEVQRWIETGIVVGQSAVAVGTTTGNPYAVAWGGGLVAVGTVLASILFGGRKKKDGES